MCRAGRTAGRLSRGTGLSIPNLITLARILVVPIIVWAITADHMLVAFVLFVVAGLSDLVDGFLAKRFGMATKLGAYLDPLADKAMIVSIYVALGIADAIPRWLVILVVSRDIMIVSAVLLSWLVGKPVDLKPITVSKLNTLAQVVFAVVVLATLGFGINADLLIKALIALVTALTLVSIALYLAQWVRHMNATESR
jgi:cardiolipin synthase (CMP-forming)